MSAYINYFFEGSLLGLVTGSSCAVFCVPILLGITSRNINKITPAIDLVTFLIGRLIAYIGVALVFSFIGEYIKLFYSIKSIIKIIAGVFLMYWGIRGFFKTSKDESVCLNKKFSNAVPFIAGILTGISPCPPFITGVTRVVLLASPLIGIIYFMGFYLSTSLFLIPGLFTFFFKYKKELRVIALFISVIFGVIFFLSGILEIIFVKF
jgi:sulfite exporter TauE/SafE